MAWQAQEELASPGDRLEKTSAAFGKLVQRRPNWWPTKQTLLTSSNFSLLILMSMLISMDIRINSEKLDEVKSFKYLSAVVTDQGSEREELSRIAQTTAALARLKTIWDDKYISLRSD